VRTGRNCRDSREFRRVLVEGVEIGQAALSRPPPCLPSPLFVVSGNMLSGGRGRGISRRLHASLFCFPQFIGAGEFQLKSAVSSSDEGLALSPQPALSSWSPRFSVAEDKSVLGSEIGGGVWLSAVCLACGFPHFRPLRSDDGLLTGVLLGPSGSSSIAL